MTDDAQKADDLDAMSGRDHALVVGMAALQAVPVVGGVVATFISEYVPRQRQQRLIGFVQNLADEFVAEQERIDSEFVKTKDFSRMCEDVLDRVTTVRNEEKLGYWAALLAGVATKERPGQSDRNRMIDTLDGLRPEHLRLLHVIATTSQPPPGMFLGAATNWILKSKMPDVSDDEGRRRWNDLNRLDLVDPYPVGLMAANEGANLAARLTPYGRSFVRMLRLESGSGDGMPDEVLEAAAAEPRSERAEPGILTLLKEQAAGLETTQTLPRCGQSASGSDAPGRPYIGECVRPRGHEGPHSVVLFQHDSYELGS